MLHATRVETAMASTVGYQGGLVFDALARLVPLARAGTVVKGDNEYR